MSRVYSQRLAVSHAGALSGYSVPAGMRTVVRDIVCFNASPLVPETVSVVELRSGATIWQVNILPQTCSVVEMRWVLEYGDAIEVRPGGECDVQVAGFELVLP